MKLRYLTACGLAFALTLGSCGEDFLYKAPQGSSSQEALTNEAGVELLVINAYANLTENDWGASPFNWTFGGMYGGDANKGSDPGDQSVLNEMELYNTMATNGYLGDKFKWTYKGAKRANLAMQIAAEVEYSNPQKKELRMGELYFLRAMFYFESVKVFGPYLPFIDESYTENDPKDYNDENIYPHILADLEKAEKVLPKGGAEEVGRVNYYAARALRAKVLMQMGDMAAAKPVLKEVIEEGVTSNGLKYALEDDLNANFDTFRDNGSESIYAIQFSSDGNDNGNTGMSLCYPHNSGPGGCCGFYQPSFELVNSFQVDENGLPYLNAEYRSKPTVTKKVDTDDFSANDNSIAVDPRLDFAVGRYHIPYKDWGFPANDWIRNPVNGGIFLPKKHVYSKAEDVGKYARKDMSLGWSPGSAMNLQYLSLRDMMLLYAECLANDGELSTAMDLVNQIRRRAALDVNIIKLEDGTPAANYKIAEYPSSHAAFTDKSTCIKAIRMERKLELAMEGQRWFDLVRWGGDIMASEIRAYIDYEQQFIPKFAGASYLPASKTMFPLPDEQIQSMGNDPSGKPYLVQPDPWK